jgi:hypothetical protein
MTHGKSGPSSLVDEHEIYICGSTGTLRDVRNEATSGDVHENKGDADKMSGQTRGLLHENAPIER